MARRTIFLAVKAAPACHLAKAIIKVVNNLSGTIDGDASVNDKMQVLFLPEYGVTPAERLIPASDALSQISPAVFEASGTNNMKFIVD